jgi:hypothetical protein
MTMNSDAAIEPLWASQEMLIHSNDALQKELAEFRELFEAKLPAVKNQSSCKLCLGDSLMVLMIRPGPGNGPWHGKMWTNLIA